MDKDQAERRVIRAIKHTLALIAEQDPELARLLGETIKTASTSRTSLCRSLAAITARKENSASAAKEPSPTRAKVTCPGLFRFPSSAQLLPQISHWDGDFPATLIKDEPPASVKLGLADNTAEAMETKKPNGVETFQAPNFQVGFESMQYTPS